MSGQAGGTRGHQGAINELLTRIRNSVVLDLPQCVPVASDVGALMEER